MGPPPTASPAALHVSALHVSCRGACRHAAGLVQRGATPCTNFRCCTHLPPIRPGGEAVPKALHVSPLMDMKATW